MIYLNINRFIIFLNIIFFILEKKKRKENQESVIRNRSPESKIKCSARHLLKSDDEEQF